MIVNFDDFCTWAFVIIDDLWKTIGPLFNHSGPQPGCSDSELITLAIVGECKGWDHQTELISNWKSYRHLFPQIPERSRFNRDFELASANQADLTVGLELLENYAGLRVVADKAYISQPEQQRLQQSREIELLTNP